MNRSYTGVLLIARPAASVPELVRLDLQEIIILRFEKERDRDSSRERPNEQLVEIQ
jgi:hypothetical protein